MQSKICSLKPFRPCLFILTFFLITLPLHAQYTMPQAMDTATLNGQLEYIEKSTRIYNDFRAIREDIFQKIKKNSQDSLSVAKKGIHDLQSVIDQKDSEIGTLSNKLKNAEKERDDAIQNKNALAFFGIQMDKKFYNTLMISILGTLLVFLIILFVVYRQNRRITVEYRDDLDETKEAFEKYKKESRERYEKLVVNHHNEIMKLKGN